MKAVKILLAVVVMLSIPFWFFPWLAYKSFKEAYLMTYRWLWENG